MPLVELDLKPGRRTLAQFGLIVLVLFGAAGALVLWKHRLFGIPLGAAAHPVAWTLWGAGLVSGLFSLTAPGLNRYLYTGLVVITFPIGFVLSYVIMGIVFYLVITPVGLFFRLIGRDALQRRFKPGAATYWVDHADPEDMERYFRQY